MWKILAELAFLALLAILYYFFQRHRILRNDKREIYKSLHEMIIDIHQFLEENQDIRHHDKITSFVADLEKFNEAKDYESLSLITKEAPSFLPNKFSDSFASFHDQIRFHVRK